MELRKRSLDKKSYILILLVILALIPRITYYVLELRLDGGLPQAFDTKVYLEQAYAFINNGIIDKDFNGIFYVSFYGFLGLFLKIIPSTDIFVLFQMIINAITVIAVYKLGNELFNENAAIIAGILYSFLTPLIHWSIFITTDSLFVTLMIIQAYIAVLCVKYKKKGTWIILGIASLYMVFFRPTGIVTLGFTALYLLINADIKGLIIKHKKVSAAVFLTLTAILAVCVKMLINNPLLGSLERNMYWLLTEVYANGQIYDIRSPYDLKLNITTPPGYDFNFAVTFFRYNFMEILHLYFRRIVSFLGVWIWETGSMSIFNTLIHLFLYGLAILFFTAGIIAMYKQNILKKGSIILLMIASILIFTTFFFMDSAYRYRVPALVFCIYPVSAGIGLFVERIRTYYIDKMHFKVMKKIL